MILHGYWRSGAAYRVRIGLALKGIAYAQIAHDLRKGEQGEADYAGINPQKLVPALEVDGAVLTQSSAILEWLEETYPDPPLMPGRAEDRAIVRAMIATIGADIHPLHNLRVLKALKHDFGADDTARDAWIARWMNDGFAALDAMIARHGAGYAFGASPTLADCFIVPALYSADRFGVALTPYPALAAAGERAGANPAIAAAHPTRQPDFDPAA